MLVIPGTQNPKDKRLPAENQAAAYSQPTEVWE
jgi:hypothetical protein